MKYALYKNRSGVGLNSWKYAENEEEAKEAGAMGLSLRKVEYPIVVNRVGGNSSFYKGENFVEIREEPLTREEAFPRNHEEFELGWISPEGDTYSCEYESHYLCAEMLCEEMGIESTRAEKTLEEAGWVKVTKGYGRGEKMVYAKDYYITKAQADKLFDLGMYDDERVKWMVKQSEGKW